MSVTLKVLTRQDQIEEDRLKKRCAVRILWRKRDAGIVRG